MTMQLDNPACILTQDASKSFLTASTPEQKYEVGCSLLLQQQQFREVESAKRGVSVYVRVGGEGGMLLSLRAEIEAVVRRREASPAVLSAMLGLSSFLSGPFVSLLAAYRTLSLISVFSVTK